MYSRDCKLRFGMLRLSQIWPVGASSIWLLFLLDMSPDYLKIFCYPQDDHESSFYSLSSGINYFSRIFLCLIFNRDFRLEIMILYLVVLLLCCHCSKFQQTEMGIDAHTYTRTHISMHLSVYFFTFLHFKTAYGGTSNPIPAPQNSSFSSPFQTVTPFPSCEKPKAILVTR